MKVVDETVDDIQSLIERDFGRVSKENHFYDYIVDWLQYRARLIPRRPRNVVFSERIGDKVVSFPAINDISYALKFGEDVTPWLSSQVLRPHTAKPDDMFNDWSITHFHLGGFFRNRQQIQRTQFLLFALVAPDEAILLDVRSHGDWTQRDILRQLLFTAPQYMERHELRGQVEPTQKFDEIDLKKFRKNQINTFIEVDGRYFMPPGGGLASSGHSIRFVRFRDEIFDNIEDVKLNIEKNTAPSHIMKELTQVISMPVRLGLALSYRCLIIFDKNRNCNIGYIGPLS